MKNQKALQSLIAKFHPSKHPQMSPKMAFILGLILNQEWANTGGDNPVSCVHSSMSITSDGFIIINGCFVGDYSDFLRNVNSLFNFTRCSKNEQKVFWNLFDQRVTNYQKIHGKFEPVSR